MAFFRLPLARRRETGMRTEREQGGERQPQLLIVLKKENRYNDRGRAARVGLEVRLFHEKSLDQENGCSLLGAMPTPMLK